MNLAPSDRIGSYTIVALLGAGGMGEVYRARDPRLGRDVALKILPPAFASDPARLARFKREAQLLASLNHSNVAAVYGFEENEGVDALVMELIEGPTLAEWLGREPIPIDEALRIAKQIAEALEAAHEQGIVHRDLKPANIKVRPDGTVKVLDFGLAKAMEPPTGSDVSATSPAVTAPAVTQNGVIVGTAAYMSPEQAKGKPADKRSDIWAFGCVVYEMLTGRAAFPGATIIEVLTSTLTRDPDWAAFPAATPAAATTLIRRCLARDPRQRLRDIGDARLTVEELIREHAESVPKSATVRTPVATLRTVLVFLAGAAAGVAAWAALRPMPSSRDGAIRLSIVPPVAQPLVPSGYGRDLALSPDGTRLVYRTNQGQLLVRAMDSLTVIPLENSEGADSPFFSPDGNWVAFFTGVTGELKKVAVTGGAPVSLCRYQGVSRGGSWGGDGTIVFATNDPATGLMRVPAAGGSPTVLTTPDRRKGESDHVFPSFAADGRAIVFTVTSGDSTNGAIHLLDVKTGHLTKLVEGASVAEVLEPEGYLVYASTGTLRAVRANLSSASVANDAPVVIGPVSSAASGAAEFSLSRTARSRTCQAARSVRRGRSPGLTVKDGKSRSTPRPADTNTLACRQMEGRSRSTSGTRPTTSGFGTFRARR